MVHYLNNLSKDFFDAEGSEVSNSASGGGGGNISSSVITVGALLAPPGSYSISLDTSVGVPARTFLHFITKEFCISLIFLIQKTSGSCSLQI
jgi:hypothetical protein